MNEQTTPQAQPEAVLSSAELGAALQRFDRLLSGTVGAFPWTDDPVRMLEVIQEAGRHGVTLYWLKATFAAITDHESVKTKDGLEDHWRRVPWAAPQHRGWQEKYRRNGWVYDFASDTWGAPNTDSADNPVA